MKLAGVVTSLVIVAAALVSPDRVHAADGFVTRDSAFGANTLISDTTSGKTWLTLDVTDGLALTGVMSETGAGGTFQGFQLASPADMYELVQNYGAGFPDLWVTGFSFPVAPEMFLAAQSFIDVFGGASSSLISGKYDSNGDPLNPAGDNDIFELWLAGSDHVGYAVDICCQVFNGAGQAGTGVWLFTTTPPVPEPQTYALMLAGLLAMVVVVRKRGATSALRLRRLRRR
jgi:hypothetical protein